MRRLARTIVVLLYLGVLFALWWFTPPGPREGWQIPRDEMPIGFVGDEALLVTVPASPNPLHPTKFVDRGPIRVWDIRSGALVAQRFTDKDRIVAASTQGRLVIVISQVDLTTPKFVVRVYDPITSRDLGTYESYFPYAIISPNAERTAHLDLGANGQLVVRIRDLASEKQPQEIKQGMRPDFFSKDGRYLVGHDTRSQFGQTVTLTRIWDLTTNSLRREVPLPQFTGQACEPKDLSPDGRLLLDSTCRVWDIARGLQALFSVPGIHSNSLLFSADGRHLIVIKNVEKEAWLIYYDTATGEEVRRMLLTRGDILSLSLRPATPDRRYLVASGFARHSKPNWALQWLAKIPGLQGLAAEPSETEFIVIETVTGRVISRGRTLVAFCSPSGEFLVTDTQNAVCSLWNNPARRPYRLLTFISLGWTTPFAFGWWRAWRKRKRGESVAATHSLLADSPAGEAT